MQNNETYTERCKMEWFGVTLRNHPSYRSEEIAVHYLGKTIHAIVAPDALAHAVLVLCVDALVHGASPEQYVLAVPDEGKDAMRWKSLTDDEIQYRRVHLAFLVPRLLFYFSRRLRSLQ